MAILKIEDIMELIPHRYPFLLIDRILEITEDSAVALKNVTANEEMFCGHFPGHPIMLGVLILEAMAQAAAVFVATLGSMEGKVVYFASADKVKFRKPVVPGDALIIHVKRLKARGNFWRMQGVAKVEGEQVADAEFSAMIIDK